MKLKDYLKLPDSVSRRFRPCSRIRRYKREKRRKFTKDEIIAYLRDNNIRSIPQLQRFRKEGDPNVYDVRKAFGGKWSNAINEVFVPSLPLEPTKEYILKTVLWMNIKRRRDYLEARKREPGIVPSINVVRKAFGTFKNMMYFARQYNLEETLRLSVKLYLKYGRTPTMLEYKAAHIGIDTVIDSFGGKWRWDKCVKDAVRRMGRERQIRSA